MKRSEINAIMGRAAEFLRARQFFLPPFAYWTPEEWRSKGSEAAEIVENQLGWDITDFGHGSFEQIGLFLFTLRNGNPKNFREMNGKLYAEKILIVQENQITPFHYHMHKMEDIINRGGGELLVQIYNSTADGAQLADSDVMVSMDGVIYTLPAGAVVSLGPGESISLPTRLYHKFWGAPGRGTVLVGEVSLVNDDSTDNRFLQDMGRFPHVEEDVPPLHLLVGDYPAYYRAARSS